MSSAYDKLKADDLKKKLKDIGMVQSGDKGTLIFRLKLFDKCKSENLVTADSRNPCQLGPADLKKCASMLGISPMGTPDEILDEYVKILSIEKLRNSSSTASNSSSNDTSKPSGGVDPVMVAQMILDMGEGEDYEGILNIAALPGQPISRQTPAPIMRKAYLKLSLLVHPDKIGRIFPQAAKAFQTLARAFDYLTSVDIDTSGDDKASSRSGGKQKVFTISRSNEGCHRTRVCCPRCRQPWSEGTLDGNPNFFYNFLMQGLKCFTCSTCLFEFGCMTAQHRCPHCNKTFEYSIEDYHRKIKCPSNKCGKLFGFFLFPVSDRMMKELRAEIKDEQERRLKAREAKLRRANRSISKLSTAESERAFILGLVDCCPRCGESFEGYPDEEAQRMHLAECTDTVKHTQHKEKESKAEQKVADKEKKRALQESAQTQAAWSFLGAQTSQLWLLDEDQVRSEATKLGISATGADKDQLISKIVEKKERKSTADNDDEVLYIDSGVKGGASGSSNGEGDGTRTQHELVLRKKRQRLNPDSVPSNLHSLGAAQLRSICAANGLLAELPVDASRDMLITTIEDALMEE